MASSATWSHPGKPADALPGTTASTESRCAIYLPGQKGSIAGTESEITELLEQGRFFWIDMREPSGMVDGGLLEALTVSQRSRWFVSNFGARGLAGRIEDEAWLVIAGIRDDDSIVEVHVVVCDRYILTVHREAFPVLEELVETADEVSDIRAGVTVDAPLALHRITEVIVESISSLIDRMDDDIDDLQMDIFRSPTDEHLVQLFKMRRDIVQIRRIVGPQRDAFSRLASHIVDFPGFDADDDFYFRVAYEQFFRLNDLLDSYRDLLSGALDVYLATVSNRLGEISKQLTVIATIFLPLTFLTGFFGQNFEFLTSHIGGVGAFLVFGIGAELVVLAILFYFFRKRGWIDRRRALEIDRQTLGI